MMPLALLPSALPVFPAPRSFGARIAGRCALLMAALACASAMADDQALPERQTGKASYYGPKFFGRPMADGTPFDPESNHAASRTLPLGTWVRVTNRENGKSEIVQIRDRGPYVDGRVIDLSPRTAKELDMIEDGVVEVEVVPLDEEERQLAQSEDGESAFATSGE
ncbi:MAG TPA: septal ring lytic transglycosylase RlpA family protein [Noviherbaspirillum sp.]